jgi:hypothetical protein
MFWGKGDSSKLGPEERAELEKLRRLVETGHLVALSPEQTDIALAAIKFYGNVTATSGILAGAKNVGLWIAGLVMFWWVSRDAVVTFIQAVAKTGGAGH